MLVAPNLTALPNTDVPTPGRASRRVSTPQTRVSAPREPGMLAMANKSKKRRLEEFLRERQPEAISEERWRELAALLAPISENYLRDLLQATGLAIAQPFGGVRLSSFKDLEASLLEMEKEYSKAVANHDRRRASACRRTVIQAKDRTRLISRNQKVDAQKRRQKAEMVEWMLVWLENPGIFESWAALRKKSVTYRLEPG
jgi:hypothetical protein